MMTYERDARFIIIRDVDGLVEIVDPEPMLLQHAEVWLDAGKRNRNPGILDEVEHLAVIVTRKDARDVECLIDRRRCAAELKYELDPAVLARLDKPAFRSLVGLLADRDEERKQAECRAENLERALDEARASQIRPTAKHSNGLAKRNGKHEKPAHRRTALRSKASTEPAAI